MILWVRTHLCNLFCSLIAGTLAGDGTAQADPYILGLGSSLGGICLAWNVHYGTLIRMTGISAEIGGH